MIPSLSAPLRAAVLYAVAIAWGKGLSLMLLPVMTAHLSPAEFGRLELLASAAEVAALLVGAGLVETLYRFGAAGGDAARRAAAEITGLALTAAALTLALAAAAGAALHDTQAGVEVVLLGIAVAMGPLIGVGLAILRLEADPRRYAGFEVARATLQAGLVAALLAAGFGVTGVLAGGACVATLAGLALLLRQWRRGGLRFEATAWCPLLAYGVPLIGSGLAGFALGTADRWVLAGLVPPEVLGQYGLAAKLALVAAVLMQPFDLWWYAQRQRVLAEPGGAARTARIVGAGAAVAVLAATAAAMAGPVVIALLTPAAFHGAAALVPWIAAAVALQSLGSLVNVGCYTGRTGRLPLLANGIAAGVAVAGYLLLIPPFGVEGTLAATLVAQGVRFGIFLRLSQRIARVAYPLGRVAVLALACVAAVHALHGMPPAGGAVAALAALAALAGLALALRLLPWPRRAAVPRPAHA
jgi:O-antigen/teichoic acid export membrane protein